MDDCIFATLGTCHSVRMTVSMRHLILVALDGPLHTSHPYRVKSTKCCIDTFISPDDGYIVARNT